MSAKDAEDQLNRLLTRSYDAEKGYQTVAEKVDHPELRSFLIGNSEERNKFGHEIKGILSEMNLKPDKGSSLTADVHRAWINIKDVVSANSDKAILDEAERGEDFAVNDYQEALKNTSLSPGNQRKLSDQLNAIKKSKEQIGKLRATL